MDPFWFLIIFIAFSPFLSPFFAWKWEKTTNYSIGVFLLFMLFCLHIWAIFSLWEYYLLWLIWWSFLWFPISILASILIFAGVKK